MEKTSAFYKAETDAQQLLTASKAVAIETDAKYARLQTELDDVRVRNVTSSFIVTAIEVQKSSHFISSVNTYTAMDISNYVDNG